MIKRHVVITILGVAAWLFLCVMASSFGTASGSLPESSVTFYKDVAPILQRHCVECHRPGGIAPMSLGTYEEVKGYASAMREKVIAGEMPPWHADPRFGEFANDRSLSDREIGTIVAWIDRGAPSGELIPLPPGPAETSKIGKPDVVFQMAEPYRLDGKVMDEYVYFRIPTNFKEDKWAQAVAFLPGNRRVVHHAVAFIESPARFAEAQRKNPSPPGHPDVWTILDTEISPVELMDGTTRRVRLDAPVLDDGCSGPEEEAAGGFGSTEILSVYAPGREADVWPSGTARRIPAGSNIILQMHYSKPPGGVESDRTGVAFGARQE
jgi:mono/diheme cytochrome c family protein